jgi:acyl carrier protein/3-phenylpropionate/cinnamic acid dioxygenase small subunit
LVKYSITLMDEHGVELVDIEEYKRLTVSEAAKERLEEEETAPGVKEQIIGHGILPTEGIEVFSRILGRGLPWVLVSTRDFASVLEVNRGSKEGGADMPDELEQEKPSGPLRPRPEITKPYVPPGSEIEIAIAQIWQDFLGIEKIGVHDDFFELGGDSLKVMTIIAKIRKKLDVEISIGEFFNKPTIQGISGSIAGIKKSLYTEIEFLEKKEYYPLSSAQKRIHTLCQIDPTSTVYNLPVFFEMEGRGFDREKVAEIFRTLIKRHESLQTWFEEINGEFAQRTTDELELELEFYDIQDIKQEGQNAEGKDKVIDHFIRPFDLSKVPLVRVGLMKLAETRHVLMLDMHHIVSDGLSLLILYRDFLALYEGLQLPVLTTTYKDYAQWQSRKKAQKLLKQQEAYWLKQFESDIPVLNLPTDYPRSSEIKNFEGSQLYFNLSEEKTRVLRKLALEEGVTLYMLLLAIFYVVLFKLSGQEDIIVGSPLAGRNHSDLQHIIGMFVNTLALRNFPAENKTFSQFLKEVKERTLEAFENQDYQFEELVEKIKVRRDMSRNPLFDVMFELKNMLTQGVDMVETGVTGMKITQYEYKRNTSAFDLMMSISELEHHLDFRLDYSTKLFKKERIERFWGLFKEILDCVSDNREIILKDIKISHYLGVASVSMPETGFEF